MRQIRAATSRLPAVGSTASVSRRHKPHYELSPSPARRWAHCSGSSSTKQEEMLARRVFWQSLRALLLHFVPSPQTTITYPTLQLSQSLSMSHHTEELTTGEHNTFFKMDKEAKEAFDAEQWKVAQTRFVALLHFARASGDPDRQEAVDRAYSGIGSALSAQRKYHLALKIYDEAIYYHTDNVAMVLANLYAKKAALLQMLGDNEAALQWADKGIKAAPREAAPDDDLAYVIKLSALLALGKPDEVLVIVKSRTEATEPATLELSNVYRYAKKRAEELLVTQGGSVLVE